jgi:hypothetical protein
MQAVVDRAPIIVVFLAIVGGLFVVFEIGYRLGIWQQRRTPDVEEGPHSLLVGSLIGVMGFLIAVTMSMAADRFDARRGLVLEEANAIGTTYLRAGFLPDGERDRVRNLLREYAPLRVNTSDASQLAAQFERSTEIQTELWAVAERVKEDSETFSLFADSLNETIDLHEARVAAIVYARVPETIFFVLLIGTALTIAVVGYNGGLKEVRGIVGAVVLIVFLASVLTLIVDIDRPRDGFLQVSQQPLIDLAEDIGLPG